MVIDEWHNGGPRHGISVHLKCNPISTTTSHSIGNVDFRKPLTLTNPISPETVSVCEEMIWLCSSPGGWSQTIMELNRFCAGVVTSSLLL